MSIVVCEFEGGCTNQFATNFNPFAETDDGSCLFIDACGNAVPAGDTSCDIDCNGDGNGSAYLDECVVCSEGNSGHVANSDKDCNGDCYGDAYLDDCDICSEGLSGHTANSDKDCNDVCFGEWRMDECGVCGDPDDVSFDSSCDISIGIQWWQFKNYSAEDVWFWWNFPQFGDNPPSTNDNVYLNCVNIEGNPPCISANVGSALYSEQFLMPTIKATGIVFDEEGGSSPEDYQKNITMKVAVIINRYVQIVGVGESDCEWIFGSEFSPEISEEITYEPLQNQFSLNFPTSPLLDLFQDVEIGGTTYALDLHTEFNAQYQMWMYISEFSLEDPDPFEYDNLSINDVNNQIHNHFQIHALPYHECDYALGDVDNSGIVDCEDLAIAETMLLDDYCGEDSPDPACCSLWNLSPTSELDPNILNHHDLIMLINLLLDAGADCG